MFKMFTRVLSQHLGSFVVCLCFAAVIIWGLFLPLLLSEGEGAEKSTGPKWTKLKGQQLELMKGFVKRNPTVKVVKVDFFQEGHDPSWPSTRLVTLQGIEHPEDRVEISFHIPLAAHRLEVHASGYSFDSIPLVGDEVWVWIDDDGQIAILPLSASQ